MKPEAEMTCEEYESAYDELETKENNKIDAIPFFRGVDETGYCRHCAHYDQVTFFCDYYNHKAPLDINILSEVNVTVEDLPGDEAQVVTEALIEEGAAGKCAYLVRRPNSEIMTAQELEERRHAIEE